MKLNLEYNSYSYLEFFKVTVFRYSLKHIFLDFVKHGRLKILFLRLCSIFPKDMELSSVISEHVKFTATAKQVVQAGSSQKHYAM